MSIVERVIAWHTARKARRRMIEDECARIDQEQRVAWVGQDLEQMSPEQLDRLLAVVIAEAQADARRKLA